MTTALAQQHHAGELVELQPEFSVERVVAQTVAVQQCMQAVMRKDEHYGVIPGTGTKPSLLQPGADKLCTLFRLRAEYDLVEDLRDDFISVTVKCRLIHIPTDKTWGTGVGAANSREKKYSAQSTAKICPKCGKPAIIKGKEEYGGGWVCFKKKDGCNAKWPDGAKEIEQQAATVQPLAVWDLQNTIYKMACKRAKVAAVLTATAASDIFTQDLEDLAEAQALYSPPKPARAPAPTESTPAPKGAAAPPSAPKTNTAASPTSTTSEPVIGGHNATGLRAREEPGDHDPITGEVIDAEVEHEAITGETVEELRGLLLSQLKMNNQHARNWLAKYFGTPNVMNLDEPHGLAAVELAQAKVKGEDEFNETLTRLVLAGLAKDAG